MFIKQRPNTICEGISLQRRWDICNDRDIGNSLSSGSPLFREREGKMRSRFVAKGADPSLKPFQWALWPARQSCFPSLIVHSISLAIWKDGRYEKRDRGWISRNRVWSLYPTSCPKECGKSNRMSIKRYIRNQEWNKILPDDRPQPMSKHHQGFFHIKSS